MVNDVVMMHKCLQGLSPIATCRTNFQLELLFTTGRQDIETASMFHNVESLLANAPFITVA